jgi:hypothetical protein
MFYAEERKFSIGRRSFHYSFSWTFRRIRDSKSATQCDGQKVYDEVILNLPQQHFHMDNSVNFNASHLQYCAERLPSGKFILLGQLFKWYSIAVDKGQSRFVRTQYTVHSTVTGYCWTHGFDRYKRSVDLVDLYNVRFFCKNALPLEFRQRNFGQFFMFSLYCV